MVALVASINYELALDVLQINIRRCRNPGGKGPWLSQIL